MTTYTIPSNILRALLPFAGDESRRELCGIQLESGPWGTLAVACDGRRLLAYRYSTREEQPDKLFVPVNTWTKLLPGGKREVIVEFECSPGAPIECSVGATHILIDYSPKEPYPNWRRVVPTKTGAPAPLNLNALLLAKFSRAAKLITGNEGLVITQEEQPIGPYLIRTPSNPEFLGVLMPIRWTNTAELPAWVKEGK